MAQPDPSPIPLGTSPRSSKPAFLVKFPQDIWERILASGSGSLQISHNEAKLSLILPDRTIAMDTQPLNPTEIYELSDSLQPLGVASTRLSVPFSVASSSKATEVARAPDKAHKHGTGGESNGLARVKQQAAVPLARSHSSPVGATASGAAPVIPLKTRVVQHLALGPASVEEIVGKVGGAETDVMRVVKVVGRQVDENPPRYSLQPSQYTKIKLADWRYTPEEQARVGELAKEAFDELEFPPDADERMDLERKLAEAAVAPVRDPTPPAPVTQPPPRRAREAPAPTAATTTSSETPADNPPSSSTSIPKHRLSTTSSSGSKKGVVAREMAKFRAEQVRSTSAPASKAANGVASPRAGPSALSNTPDKVSKKRNGTVDKAERSDTSSRSDERDGKGKGEKKRKRDRQPSPEFTSSEEEELESSRGRAKQRGAGTPKTKAAVAVKDSAPTKSPLSFTKRKSPPQPLQLKHQPKSSTPSTTTSERPDDPEELRDRYEELYPAYQQLTTKLIALHQAAEGVEGGDSDVDVLPSKAEMEKMVGKWERWHNELTGIRRWFGSEPV